METLVFDTTNPVDFHWTGKFQAPDCNWIHMTRPLTDFEFVLVTDGDFYIGDGTHKSVVHKGEYRIIKPTENQHGTKASLCSFYWMHFSSDSCKIKQADTKAENQFYLPEQAAVPHPERLIVLLKQLSDCDKKYNDKVLCNFLCTTILCELNNQLKNTKNETSCENPNRPLHGAQVALYSDIVNYINWRIKENILVSEIANYFGYNDKYITTFFKRASGKPIKQFILEQKMEEAKAMLSDSTKQVAQIGYNLGFADNHNFARAFKKITGQTPSEYRNSFADRMLYNV